MNPNAEPSLASGHNHKVYKRWFLVLTEKTVNLLKTYKIINIAEVLQDHR